MCEPVSWLWREEPESFGSEAQGLAVTLLWLSASLDGLMRASQNTGVLDQEQCRTSVRLNLMFAETQHFIVSPNCSWLASKFLTGVWVCVRDLVWCDKEEVVRSQVCSRGLRNSAQTKFLNLIVVNPNCCFSKQFAALTQSYNFGAFVILNVWNLLQLRCFTKMTVPGYERASAVIGGLS